MTFRNVIIVIAIWSSAGTLTYGQTCCSGGVPISSNLGFNAADAGVLQVRVGAHLNLLRRLYEGADQLNDDFRTRTTHSFNFRAAYNITRRFSIETFLPVIRQSRKIIARDRGTNIETTFGIGDPVLLFMFDLAVDPISFRIGAGPQIPVGRTNHRNDLGLLLVEDLQPGSGAWDGIFFSSLSIPWQSRPSRVGYLNAIYSLTGKNRQARGGNQTYQFGDELQLIGGITDQFLTGNQIIDGGIALRYRSAARDAINNIEGTSTGGNFLFLKLDTGITFPNHGFQVSTEIPVYTFVNEIQMATTFIISVGWHKKIDLKSNNEGSIDFEPIDF